MIGHDALPMSDPYNYKFTPGTLGTVSEYFRLIATTDILLCNSEFTKGQALNSVSYKNLRAHETPEQLGRR